LEKLIITAAICGAEVTKEDNPNLPITPEELADAALAAEKAGASIIHLHVRDGSGKPTQKKEVFKEVLSKMHRRNIKAIIQLSTGGDTGMNVYERIQPVYLYPEMASLDCGSVNFGNEVFINDFPLMRNFASEMKKLDIMPELECFEPGHVYNAIKLQEEGLLPKHLHCGLIMGVPGAIKASIENLLFMVELLPFGTTWMVAGIGRYELQMAAHAIIMGGHVRVGFEDNIYYSKGVLAESNAQLVARFAKLADELGRDVATPSEARRILKLERCNIIINLKQQGGL